MAAKLKWNAPGLKWNSPGAVWNGTAVRPKPMSKVKAIVDFTSYTGPDLGPVAQTIHDQMTANAATFTTPPVTMAALLTLIDTFNTTLAAKASRATADVIAFNQARGEVEDALGELGGYVNGVAKGDQAMVEQSGFPYYSTARTPDTAPPAAPGGLQARAGDLPGSVIARYKPDRSPSVNEVQVNTGDPNLETGWTTVGLFSGGKATLTGLTPGALIWVRVRTAGIKGVLGVWSDPARVRVL